MFRKMPAFCAGTRKVFLFLIHCPVLRLALHNTPHENFLMTEGHLVIPSYCRPFHASPSFLQHFEPVFPAHTISLPGLPSLHLHLSALHLFPRLMPPSGSLPGLPDGIQSSMSLSFMQMCIPSSPSHVPRSPPSGMHFWVATWRAALGDLSWRLSLICF